MNFAYFHVEMKKTTLLIWILIFFSTDVFGQSLLGITGNSLQNNSLTVDYSIGEIAINTLSSSSTYATIGFLQPYALTKRQPTNDEQIIVYQFLSPNQDGDNETFHISGLPPLLENEVLVFDRTGKTVFSAKNYDNGWNGGNLPEGNYFYVVKIPSKKLELKGGLVIAK